MKIRVAPVLALCACLLGWPAHALEIRRWERLPLAVDLRVDQERVVFVDRNVRVGVPASLGDRLRIQSAAGAIYLLAHAPIPPTRLQVQDVDSGSVLLLDIAAHPAEAGERPLEPVRILVDTPAVDGNDASIPAAPPRSPDRTRPGTPAAVLLTRYAAQSLYAPLRTIEALPGVARVNLRRRLTLETLLPALPVDASALAAWRLDDVWVTAVRLRNREGRALELDPRYLQGDFVAATFQHDRLGPSATPEDTTVVYLVTRSHGLEGALLPALSPVDAAINLPPADAGEERGHAQ